MKKTTPNPNPNPNPTIDPTRFVIQPDEAESLRQTLNLPSLPSLLPSLLPSARRLARPPISHFPVGAAALGSSGRIFLGANIEFAGLPLHHSIHAEQFLLANAASHNEPSILFIAVSQPPCGHCRQFLQEIRSVDQIQLFVSGSESEGEGFRSVSCFLPDPFGPSDLLNERVPLLLEPHWNDVVVEEDGDRGLGLGLGLGLERGLREAAVGAARASHAPYSGSASGFAIADGEGRVYAGSYVESAAYNPSLGPVQAAIVAYLVAGGGGGGGVGEGIVAGVLAEIGGAAVSQEETTRVLLAAVAPGARFGVCRLRVGGPA